MLLQLHDHISHSVNDACNTASYTLHLADMFHDFHQKCSIFLLLSLIWILSASKNIFWICFQAHCCSMIKIFQIFQSCLELVSQKISIDFHVSIDFYLQSFDEIS